MLPKKDVVIFKDEVGGKNKNINHRLLEEQKD
jgi:hypothetical protein